MNSAIRFSKNYWYKNRVINLLVKRNNYMKLYKGLL